MRISRRDFLKTATGVATGSLGLDLVGCSQAEAAPVVSVVRIPNDNIDYAVEHAIDLLGGINAVTTAKERVMLKPNLVFPNPEATTSPEVIRTLARLLRGAAKDVLVGEGSAAATGFNSKGEELFHTTKKEIIDGMQQYVFDQLGYSDLARSLDVPLVNLNSGDLVDVEVPGGFVYDKLTIHKSLTDVDLLCSVPMMKTHVFATVTLGMKNLIGLYPGVVYDSPRRAMHEFSSRIEPTGTAAPIVDMVRANKLGLVVVDGSMAMEGDGPSRGTTFKMDVIIAGTNPLATDMVCASIMGFRPDEVPTFAWANKAGMTPTALEEIEVRGEEVAKVKRNFARPNLVTWENARDRWAVKEI